MNRIVQTDVQACDLDRAVGRKEGSWTAGRSCAVINARILDNNSVRPTTKRGIWLLLGTLLASAIIHAIVALMPPFTLLFAALVACLVPTTGEESRCGSLPGRP